MLVAGVGDGDLVGVTERSGVGDTTGEAKILGEGLGTRVGIGDVVLTGDWLGVELAIKALMFNSRLCVDCKISRGWFRSATFVSVV